MNGIATFVAATTEEIHQTWRDYLRYLDAQQALLAADDDTLAAFEQDGDGGQAQAAARATLASIPASRRAIFDRVLEQERQQALLDAEAAQQGRGGRGPLDPAAVEDAVLQRLRDEALGIGTPTPGRGLVPLSPEADDWYEVDVLALQDAPDAATYMLRAVDGDERRRGFVRAGIVGGVALVVLLIWFFWPAQTALDAAPPPLAPSVGEGAVEPWPLRTLMLTMGATTTTLPISTTSTIGWPPLDDERPSAYWRSPALLPLTLCVPATLLDAATALVLTSEPPYPTRRYTLQAAPGDRPDLVVEPCAGDSPTRVGTLQDISLPPEQPLGEPVVVADMPLTVVAIRERSSGDDPTLPLERSWVEIIVQTPQPRDWPLLAPTLLLADGQALAASATETTADGVVLRYLVPQRNTPREVVWQLKPSAEVVLRWRATLPLPPSRLAVLHKALEITDARLTAQDEVQVTIALRLRNAADAPLTLAQTDLAASLDEQPLVLPQLAALQSPLAPEEERTLVLTLARPPADAALVLTIGPYRYALLAGKEVMPLD
jgi:hypothetical protein